MSIQTSKRGTSEEKLFVLNLGCKNMVFPQCAYFLVWAEGTLLKAQNLAPLIPGVSANRKGIVYLLLS